ncbi:MAG: hypothetical protein EOO89_24680 [Pedobacter sp.]|nr:MAG: hypothetical protein EOO89_24680 [Pedobacter sp.]
MILKLSSDAKSNARSGKDAGRVIGILNFRTCFPENAQVTGVYVQLQVFKAYAFDAWHIVVQGDILKPDMICFFH